MADKATEIWLTPEARETREASAQTTEQRYVTRARIFLLAAIAGSVLG